MILNNPTAGEIQFTILSATKGEAEVQTLGGLSWVEIMPHGTPPFTIKATKVEGAYGGAGHLTCLSLIFDGEQKLRFVSSKKQESSG